MTYEVQAKNRRNHNRWTSITEHNNIRDAERSMSDMAMCAPRTTFRTINTSTLEQVGPRIG